MESDSRGTTRQKDHLCFKHWLLLSRVTWREMTDIEMGIQPSMQDRQNVLEEARVCPRCRSGGAMQVSPAAMEPEGGVLLSSPVAVSRGGRAVDDWLLSPAGGRYGDPPTHMRPKTGRGWLVIGVAFVAGAVALIVMLSPHSHIAGAAPRPGVRAQPTSTVDVGDLRSGDCLPRGLQGTYVSTVQVGACSQPHRAEVYAVFDLAPGSFPGQGTVDRRADDGCEKDFSTYVGVAFDDSRLDFDVVDPDAATWRDDRSVVCILMDTAPHTGTLEGAHR